jgi:hypothetical protein
MRVRRPSWQGWAGKQERKNKKVRLATPLQGRSSTGRDDAVEPQASPTSIGPKSTINAADNGASILASTRRSKAEAVWDVQCNGDSNGQHYN